jgi:F-box protein 42
MKIDFHILRSIPDVIYHKKISLNRGLTEFKLCWKYQKINPDSLKFRSPAGRFSHCSIVVDSEMFVFGGASSTVTTFNDLWKFDLSSREWTRPIAIGTYPSPKAYATMAAYKDSLILLGGWRSSANTPYQTCSLFEELHVYNITENRWTAYNSLNNSPPAFAGHSATVQRDEMIVFGGYEKNIHGAHGISNEVWALDLVTMSWRKPTIANHPKPKARYGQFQVAIDDSHILMLGGCGGPVCYQVVLDFPDIIRFFIPQNAQFNDAWLLSMTGEVWRWRPVLVKNKKYSATNMWCNPSCLVSDKLVVLGPMPSVPSDLQILKHQLSQPQRNNGAAAANERSRMHERQQRYEQQREPLRNHIVDEANRRLQEERDNNNGRVAAKSGPQLVNNNNVQEARLNGRRDIQNNNNEEAVSGPLLRPQRIPIRQINDDTLPKRFNDIYAPPHGSMAAFNVPTAANNLHQERARRMEEKIAKIYATRKVSNDSKKADDTNASNTTTGDNRTPVIRQNSLAIFVCDLSKLITAVADLQNSSPYPSTSSAATAFPVLSTSELSIEWLEQKNFGVMDNAPDRLIMSTLTKGNAELIMFGGLVKESMSEVNEPINISNSLYSLSFLTEII